MNETTTDWCRVNRELIPFKLTYFLYVSAWSVMKPYLSVFLLEIGLNPAQIGIIRSLEPVTMVTASPVWGTVADKYNAHKSLMILCVVGSALSFPLLLFVPPVKGPIQNGDGYPHDLLRQDLNLIETSSWEESENYTHLSFTSDDVGDKVILDQKFGVFSQSSLLTFSLFALGTTVDNIFNSGFMPLIDSTTVEICKLHPHQSYGRQRSLGALAVVVVSPAVGLLVDFYHTCKISVDLYFLKSDFTPSFVLFTAILAIALLPVLRLEVAKCQKTPPASFSGRIISLFRDRHVSMSFFVATVTGVCKGINSAYLFIYLEELKASKFLMSLTLIAQCLPETIAMILSGKMIHFLRYEGVFCLGLLAYVIRFLGYTLVTNPWLILPMETLHGICYGLLWPNCTEYANHVAPEGMSATLQAIMNALSPGVGETIGTISGGFLIYGYGTRNLFRITATVALVTLCAYCVDVLVYIKQGNERQ